MSRGDRFVEKAKKQRRRKILRVLVVGLLVATVGGLVWLIWFSSVFVVKDAAVRGTNVLSAQQVRQVADVPVGTPLARIDPQEIAERVSTLKPVKSVEVTRRWPNTVVISVTERSAVAWVDVDGQAWAVDDAGVVYAPWSDTAGLPQISGADDKAMVAAASVAAVVSQDPRIGPLVESVSADSMDSVQLNLADGRVVIWGSAEDSEAKIKVVRALLVAVNAQQYDVSAPDLPTTTQ